MSNAEKYCKHHVSDYHVILPLDNCPHIHYKYLTSTSFLIWPLYLFFLFKRHLWVFYRRNAGWRTQFEFCYQCWVCYDMAIHCSIRLKKPSATLSKYSLLRYQLIKKDDIYILLIFPRLVNLWQVHLIVCNY